MVLLRRNTQQALSKARADHAAVETKLAELRAHRGAQLAEFDDVGAVLILDRAIAEENAKLHIVGDRIVRLQSQLAAEEAAARRLRRDAAIKAVEAMLPEREKIVAEIETAIKALPHLFEKLAAWRDKFVKQYPIADVEFPYAHFVDSDRVLRTVVEALRNIRAEDFHERIDGLAASEARYHNDLIADLKSNSASMDAESEKAA